MPTEENSDIADFEAKLLDINDCEFNLTAPKEMDIKAIEYSYFENVSLDKHLFFGGTLGQKAGGCTEMALSYNGKLIAMAISTGAILVYDTSITGFPLIRIYEGDPHEYIHLEFSSDNTS